MTSVAESFDNLFHALYAQVDNPIPSEPMNAGAVLAPLQESYRSYVHAVQESGYVGLLARMLLNARRYEQMALGKEVGLQTPTLAWDQEGRYWGALRRDLTETIAELCPPKSSETQSDKSAPVPFSPEAIMFVADDLRQIYLSGDMEREPAQRENFNRIIDEKLKCGDARGLLECVWEITALKVSLDSGGIGKDVAEGRRYLWNTNLLRITSGLSNLARVRSKARAQAPAP